MKTNTSATKAYEKASRLAARNLRGEAGLSLRALLCRLGLAQRPTALPAGCQRAVLAEALAPLIARAPVAQQAFAWAASENIEITVRDDLPAVVAGFYSCDDGRIVIAADYQSRLPVELLVTLVHEIRHAHQHSRGLALRSEQEFLQDALHYDKTEKSKKALRQWAASRDCVEAPDVHRRDFLDRLGRGFDGDNYMNRKLSASVRHQYLSPEAARKAFGAAGRDTRAENIALDAGRKRQRRALAIPASAVLGASGHKG